jgi:hypothetical protein
MYKKRKQYKVIQGAARKIQAFVKSQNLRFEYLKYRKIVCRL